MNFQVEAAAIFPEEIELVAPAGWADHDFAARINHKVQEALPDICQASCSRPL